MSSPFLCLLGNGADFDADFLYFFFVGGLLSSLLELAEVGASASEARYISWTSNKALRGWATFSIILKCGIVAQGRRVGCT